MIAKKIVLRRATRLEYLDAVRWYKDQDSELGERFFQAVDEQFQTVEAEARKAVFQHFPLTFSFESAIHES